MTRMTRMSKSVDRTLYEALAALILMLVCSLSSVSAMEDPMNEYSVQDDPFLNDTFPAGFQWGCATSAYQVEGGWDADGKGESIWDRWCHEGGNVIGNATGDVACDSYHLYNDDINMLSNLGANFYRFSIAWSRVIPTGRLSDGVNEAGVTYYNNLIDGLLAAGIQPFVTIYHWDLPQALQDEFGGWLDEQIVQHYNDYANLCFERFGDRVKMWVTMNEPWVICWMGYGKGFEAPGVHMPGIGEYQTCHNVIKAHAAAWHTYDQVYRPTQAGRVSITLSTDWKEPNDTSVASDVEAADRAVQFMLGWLAHPIFVDGDYPPVMKQKIADKSAAEGRNQSRLPEFTEAEKAYIRGTHDFFALNHYTTWLVVDYDHGTTRPSWQFDRDVAEHFDRSWPDSGSTWLKEVPWGIRKLLGWIRDNYANPEVYITENGVSDDIQHHGSLQDDQRIRYYEGYINNILKAVKLDGCNVAGYTAWSLMDNFEWNTGYMAYFGLHKVDYEDPARTRTPKDSAAYYKQLIANNGWPPAR